MPFFVQKIFSKYKFVVKIEIANEISINRYHPPTTHPSHAIRREFG
jgi:hypothetical protein